MAPTPEFGRAKRLLWRLLWGPARIIGAVVFRVDLRRETTLPSGPVVFAPNHLAHPDPPFVGLAVRRPLRFMALDELYGHSRILDATFSLFGAIPLPRTRYPLSAMRTALHHLETGGAVGVFPEGRRVGAWGDAHPKRGAAWLAMRTGAALVPVAIWGTQHAMPLDSFRLRPARIAVRVGPPIHPDEYLDHVDPLAAMMETWRRWVDAQIHDMSDDDANRSD